MHTSKRRKAAPKRVLRLPDLEQSKSAVINSLTSKSGQRTYDHAITEFVNWYCSEPRLAFNRAVVLRYRIYLEQRYLAATTINLRLAAVRRFAYEAADSGLLSPELAAGIRRVKGVRRIGVRLGNWLTADQGRLWFSSIPNSLVGWDLAFLLRFPLGPLFSALFASFSASFRSRAALQLEILALRHQLGVLQRSVKRPKLTPADRLLWAWLCEVWKDWRSSVFFVQPATVIAWHRKGFRPFWTWKVRQGKSGRPVVPQEIRHLIRTMSRENPLWGAPRIHSELLKLGIDIGETSVSKYLLRRRRPPSPTWRTFLENHVQNMVSVDFFTVPTIRFQILYVFLVLAHDRRRMVHFGITAHPTAEGTAHQLREAFPWDTVPRYLLRDRDRIFGQAFVEQVKALGLKQVLSAPRSPWQRAYIERVIGTIRRECLDHVIVFNQRSLSRYLQSFLDYYHQTRCHLSLAKEAPEPRPVQGLEQGQVISIPQVGGPHHRYERRAA